MYTTKTTKSSRSDAHTFEVRQLDAAVVADHHVLNVSLAIDKRTNLAACLMRQLAQLSCEFRGDDLVRRYAPSVQLFDAPQLIWFQPQSIAENAANRSILSGGGL